MKSTILQSSLAMKQLAFSTKETWPKNQAVRLQTHEYANFEPIEIIKNRVLIWPWNHIWNSCCQKAGQHILTSCLRLSTVPSSLRRHRCIFECWTPSAWSKSRQSSYKSSTRPIWLNTFIMFVGHWIEALLRLHPGNGYGTAKNTCTFKICSKWQISHHTSSVADNTNALLNSEIHCFWLMRKSLQLSNFALKIVNVMEQPGLSTACTCGA